MHRSSSRPSSVLIEPLESRALLAADLSVLAASTANLASSGAKTGTVTIKNTGTTNMSGPVTVTFTAKTATGAAQTLGTKTITLPTLKPNASKAFSGITLKAPTGSGTFNVTAKITKAGDAVAANNSKAAGSVTIKSSGNTGGSSDGDAVWHITGAGAKLKFKRTKVNGENGILGSVSEMGTFTDDKGHSGTYSLVLGPKIAVNKPGQILDLGFTTVAGSFEGGSRRYVVTFTPASKRLNAGLNGKTVTFTTSAAGTSAKASPISGFLGDIYMKY